MTLAILMGPKYLFYDLSRPLVTSAVFCDLSHPRGTLQIFCDLSRPLVTLANLKLIPYKAAYREVSTIFKLDPEEPEPP